MYMHGRILFSGHNTDMSSQDVSLKSRNRVAASVAAVAAQLIVDEGLEYGPAKRQAIRQLGLPPRTPLPGHDDMQAKVREYIDLFCADTQPFELRALRDLALIWMERLLAFRPHLGGAVWLGTATRHSDIYLDLFCDDQKFAEIALFDQKLSYEARIVQSFHQKPVQALSFSVFCIPLQTAIGIHLMLHDAKDIRGALLKDRQDRKLRGDASALRQLLLASENQTST
jgi:hypothetical protein